MTSLAAVRPTNGDAVVVGTAAVVVLVVVVVGGSNVSPNLPGERVVFSSAAYESTGVVDKILMTVFEMRDSTVVGRDDENEEEETVEEEARKKVVAGEREEFDSPAAKFTTPEFISLEWFDKTGRISSPEIGDGTGASRPF